MASKKKEGGKKNYDIRASLPQFNRPHNIFEEEEEKQQEQENKMIQENQNQLSFSEKINRNLLKYKEIKLIYKKTGIAPAYLVYILFICLFFILIGYLEVYLTFLIANLYPMYISYKTLQNEAASKSDIIQWLTYW